MNDPKWTVESEDEVALGRFALTAHADFPGEYLRRGVDGPQALHDRLAIEAEVALNTHDDLVKALEAVLAENEAHDRCSTCTLRGGGHEDTCLVVRALERVEEEKQ